MTKDIVKQAMDLAEKEAQEKEIRKIKEIVQLYLEKINDKTKEKNKLDEEIRLLKKDLDDIKEGRLDKIEERQQKDENAKRLSLIIVKQIEKEYVEPFRPWRWPFEINLNPLRVEKIRLEDGTISPTYNFLDGQTSLVDTMNEFHSITGQLFSRFARGTYDIGDRIVNF